MPKLRGKLVKRDKWHFLTTTVGYDRVTVPIFESAARSCKVPLLKTLMSSRCTNDCKFCPFRAERRTRRESWTPEQLAKVTMHVWRQRRIRGLFLSSAVERDPDAAVERELEAVRLLRARGFTDYVHIRVMPGVSYGLMREAVRLADRVGINIEFPSPEHYNDMKLFLDFRQDALKRMRLLAREVKKAQAVGRCRAGLDSQMIVGASDETDKEILRVSEWLYKKLNARRVYYSAFEPIAHTPLEHKQAENRWREYRLYQCSFLLQRYGFRLKDFVLDSNDMLNLRHDPKLLFAIKNEICVDVNKAGFDELIKVPGIGLQTAKRILERRAKGAKFESKRELMRVGVLVKKAMPFIKIGSTRQKMLSEFRV